MNACAGFIKKLSEVKEELTTLVSMTKDKNISIKGIEAIANQITVKNLRALTVEISNTNFSSSTEARNAIVNLLIASHQLLQSAAANLTLLEVHLGTQPGQLKKLVNIGELSLAIEDVCDTLGVQFADRFPFYPENIAILLNSRIDNYIGLYEIEINNNLQKLYIKLKELEITLNLPERVLSHLAYMPARNLFARAQRVKDLTKANGLLSLLIPHSGPGAAAYAKILATPQSTKSMNAAIFAEAKKHSSIIGRFFRNLLRKPSMADQLYQLAKYLSKDTYFENYNRYIKTEIVYLETQTQQKTAA